MRTTAMMLLLLAAGFAGCLADDEPTATTTPDDDGAVGSPWTTEALIAADRGAGEPSVGVTPDGVLFTNIGSIVYRSHDNGTTWEDLGNPFPNIPNNDPDLAIDGDGTVWESRLYALTCNAVSVSQDAGDSWTNHPAVCEGPVGDRQYVVPADNCRAVLYWHQIPTFHQTAMSTTDCGATWLPMQPMESLDHAATVGGGSSWAGGGFWNPASDTLYATWTWTDAAGDRYPGYSATTDLNTWSPGHGPAFTGTGLGLSLVVGAADGAGNIYLAWGEAHGDDIAIYVAGSQDDGATWSDKTRIDEADTGSHVFPAITAARDGRVAIAYYEADDEAHPDDVEGDWRVRLAWSTDFWNSTGSGTWQHGPLSQDTVKTGAICISGTTCQGGREFLDYFALDVLPDGRVVGVWNSLDRHRDGGLANVASVTRDTILA